MAKNVFIVEDHPLVRETLVDLVDGAEDLQVCGAVASAEEALRQVDSAAAHIILIDLSLPHMSGMEFLAEAVRRWPTVHCMILSGHEESIYVRRAMDAGARGFIAKGYPDEIVEAIRRVGSGEIFLSGSLNRAIE